ncbi:MAG TPA: tetratricopeptide repeat protein [bacterium]|jgi:hypothetical protein|nr:tetratricopeptide repeat protein [bacterium]
MRIRAGMCIAFIAGISALPAAARAYTAEALADFQAGRNYDAAKQFRMAVLSFEAALKADPSMTGAYAALGRVYFEAGDHRGALYFYDRYLAYHPDDTATQDFADNLRVSIGGAAPAVSRHAGPFIPGFDVRGALMGVYAGDGDVNKFYDQYSTSNIPGYSASEPGDTLSYGVALGFDYGFSNGFVAGLDVQDGPLRDDAVNFSGSGIFGGTDSEKDTYTINQVTVLVTPGWRFRFGKAFVLEPRLGLGVMPSSIKVDQKFTPGTVDSADGVPSEDQTYSAAGTGFAIWPELRGEYLFGRFGLGLSVGYLYQTGTTMDYTSVPGNQTAIHVGHPVGYYSSPTASSITKWDLSTSGLSFALYGVWHFKPLF